MLPGHLVTDLTADPVAWFTAERINLQAAVEQACDHGQAALAFQIASCQCSYHHHQDRHDDAGVLWRRLAASMTDPVATLWARLRIAASMNERGRAADALPLLDTCVRLAGQASDPELLAFALYWRATSAGDLGDYAQLRHDAERGLAVARAARSRLGELVNLRGLGTGLALSGHHEPAIAAGERALAIAAELGAASYEMEVMHTLAAACHLAGRFDQAAAFSRRGIELSRELADVRGEALANGMLGDAYHGLGEYERAVDCLLRALPTLRAHQASGHQGMCCLKLGYAYQAMGRPQEAASYIEESLRIFRRLRMPQRAERARQALDRCTLTDPPLTCG